MTQFNPYQPYQPYQTYQPGYGPALPPKRFGRGLFGWVLFVSLAIMLVLLLKSNSAKFQKIALSDFYSQLLAGNVSEVNIGENALTGTMVNRRTGVNTAFITDVPTGAGSNWGCTQWLLEHATGATVSVNNQSSILTNILIPLVPWLLIFAFIWFFIIRNLKKAARPQAAMTPQIPTGPAPFSAWVYPYQPGPAPPATANSETSQTGPK